MHHPLTIIIVGGGTAGWMTAAALSQLIEKNICTITLVESAEIGTVGVGEATLPQMKDFNDFIGINEADMMQSTNATFKLGIQFVGWGKQSSSYIHPFGKFGESIAGVDFHQVWSRLNLVAKVKNIEAYSYAIQASYQNRFEFPVNDKNYINSTYSYAYHFDASLYAQYLRKFSEERDVRRVEGKIHSVKRSNATGLIESIELESGLSIKGDFFVDCSGFRSLLLREALGAEFEDWSHWLPCDRAAALPSKRIEKIPPYTRSTAKEAGWQWRIPLQHRTGNGYVFSSDFISEDKAVESLLNDVPDALAVPRLLKFKAGRYRQSWIKNCVAIGLSSGFLEPLESTSIYLIQVAIFNLLKCFPNKQVENELIAEYGRLMDLEYERIRDFLILHYHLNERDDNDLWRYCRSMKIPDSLKEKIAIYKSRGYIDQYRYGLFSLPSWIAVFNGQGLTQNLVDPFAFNISDDTAIERLNEIEKRISERVKSMPTHDEFLADYCPAKL
ncbi:MAG TPA: tryptophan halogenase family protein [Cellvibrio sp.]|nr:tryptophan halogenase family protein [Cellvibrio sp.]